MIPARKDLLERCQAGVQAAIQAGAQQAEVIVDAEQELRATLQNDDLALVETVAETRFGVRVILDGGRLGFATVNRADGLAQAAAAAVAEARLAPPDPLAGLPQAQPIPPQEDALDPALLALTPGALAQEAMALLDAIRGPDRRVHIESGGLSVSWLGRAVASSQGVQAAWRGAHAAAQLAGLAIDGADVGSLTEDEALHRSWSALQAERGTLAERLRSDCLGALGARPGETFRGPVVLLPEAAMALLWSPLLEVLGANAVRQGRSPLAGRLGSPIGAAHLTLEAGGPGLVDFPLSPFDREGMPRSRRPLIAQGVLKGFLWNSYEARAAQQPGAVGDALGSAGSLPTVGACALSLAPGGGLFAEQAPRIVVVPRFSGVTDPVSGDFSGVVKGGALLREGLRIPIRETTIAGNLYACLHQITACSAQRRTLAGVWQLPAIRVEDVSITGG